MTLSLSSKVSIASTDGLLGLALIACNPELVSSGLTTSRSSSVPAKPFGMDAVTRLKMCSRARARCSPTMRAIRNSAGSSTRCSLRNSRARKGGGLFQTTGLLEEELFLLCHLGVIEGAESQITSDGLLMLGDRRLPFAVDFDQLCIKLQLSRA